MLRSSSLLPAFVLGLSTVSGCEALDALLDPENLGAYTCDEYCEQVLDKTDECAKQQADEQCAENPDLCGEYSEEDLAAYASQGRDDWAGAGREDMLDSCNADLAAAGKTDTECQTETAVLNNISCDDILSLLGEMEANGA